MWALWHEGHLLKWKETSLPGVHIHVHDTQSERLLQLCASHLTSFPPVPTLIYLSNQLHSNGRSYSVPSFSSNFWATDNPGSQTKQKTCGRTCTVTQGHSFCVKPTLSTQKNRLALSKVLWGHTQLRGFKKISNIIPQRIVQPMWHPPQKVLLHGFWDYLLNVIY